MDVANAHAVDDIVQFWAQQTGGLAKNATELLSTPPTADVERTFSLAGVLDSKLRISSIPELRRCQMALYHNREMEGCFQNISHHHMLMCICIFWYSTFVTLRWSAILLLGCTTVFLWPVGIISLQIKTSCMVCQQGRLGTKYVVYHKGLQVADLRSPGPMTCIKRKSDIYGLLVGANKQLKGTRLA